MNYFSIFFKKFNKPWVNFSPFGRKKPKMLGNFEKFSKNFLRKLQKCIILANFSKDLTNYALVFRAFGRKTQIVGNFENFSKNFLRKLQKMNYFSIFFKKFNKPCVNFSRVWTKNTNCWEILRSFQNIS